jgi:hypothetical protein
MKYIKLLCSTFCFGLLLLVTYYIHVRFFKVGVVFYSALFDAVIASILALIIVNSLKWFSVFTLFEKLQLLLIWLLLGYSDFDQVFTQEYVKEHRLLDVRLTEQQQSGTVIIKDGCVKLTAWGQTLASSSRFFRNHLLPKQRLLMGTYSDDLTDPFRNSPAKVDYLCQ